MNEATPFHFGLALKYKIALCFCSLVLLVLSAFWLLSKGEMQQVLQQQSNALGTTLALQTAEAVKEPVLANNLLSLTVVLDQLARDSNILQISVYDIDEQLLATSGVTSNLGALRSNTAARSINDSFSAQILLQDAIAGSIQLQLNTSTLQAGIELTQFYFWIILVIGLLLALAAAFALASHITAPIISVVNAILKPDGNTIVEEDNRSDEISLLQNVSADFLAQYLKNIAEQNSLSNLQETSQSANPRNKPLKVMGSVLIVKVVNINTAIELLHPSTLSTLLNEYLFYMKQAAKLYGGTVHRFAGDSVLVFFDSREAEAEYSFNAVCCAQLFMMVIKEVAQQHRAQASQALEFRSSIHSGEVFITLATDAQQEIHNEAIVGKVIETSYILIKHSKPSQLLISETTYKQAGGEAKLAVDGSTEITMPADNMSFMAYILNNDMGDCTELLEKQSRHILPTAP